MSYKQIGYDELFCFLWYGNIYLAHWSKLMLITAYQKIYLKKIIYANYQCNYLWGDNSLTTIITSYLKITCLLNCGVKILFEFVCYMYSYFNECNLVSCNLHIVYVTVVYAGRGLTCASPHKRHIRGNVNRTTPCNVGCSPCQWNT